MTYLLFSADWFVSFLGRDHPRKNTDGQNIHPLQIKRINHVVKDRKDLPPLFFQSHYLQLSFSSKDFIFHHKVINQFRFPSIK